ncbi:hypothetical protein T440DRAFT_522954 [Plenodomus tracheiphilus IPT5]|uniref:Uncharacterized protein n=1 Tax=Plenodomus tracheiphilus IPT5 TaxID=1408161 RepID=A0A6A7ASK1_9PLEO|nr:hypothetical protein T440DRAFT_522954 [Plenodomus tracheiphilus IPT5]
MATATPLALLNVKPATHIVLPPQDAEERRIFLGPLRIIYHHCSIPMLDDHNCGKHAASLHPTFLQFLDSHMSGELQKVLERDPFIPSAVYIVGIKMTDFNYKKYGLLLEAIPEALEMQEMVELGPVAFDQFTRSPERTEVQKETYKFMAGSRLEGNDLEGSLERLIEHFCSMWKAAGTYAG